MIILAAAIILALSGNNIVRKADWAQISADRANLQSEYATILANATINKDLSNNGFGLTIAEIIDTNEYKSREKKVDETNTLFLIYVPDDDTNPAGVKVIIELTEEEMEAFGLTYNESSKSVKGYDWVFLKDNTTGDNTTGDNTTGDNTTGDNTTGDNTTGDNTTGDNTTGDNTTGDNTTGDNTMGDNTTSEPKNTITFTVYGCLLGEQECTAYEGDTWRSWLENPEFDHGQISLSSDRNVHLQWFVWHGRKVGRSSSVCRC